MSGEDDWNAVTDLRTETRQGVLDALRECGDPLGHQVPRTRDVHVDLRVPGSPRGDGSLVSGEDHRRILRRERHHDDPARAAGHERVERVCQ